MRFAIIDLEGTTLIAEERELLLNPGIAGIILFTRNYENLEQLRALTTSIKKINPSLFIAVDQEGGRVQRFREGFTDIPSMRHYGELYLRNPAQAKQALEKNIAIVAQELKNVGIGVNFTPVLDIDRADSQAIGERSFSADPQAVEDLASVVINTLHTNKMPAIGKHFPGHGSVVADSHASLPIDNRERQVIMNCDLKPYMVLSNSLDAIMPAHVVYSAFDSKPAGFSRYWLQAVLRQQLHFKGVIISDDLTMQGAAIMGDYLDRAMYALEAGCDLLTICNNRRGALTILDALEHHRNPESKARIERFCQATVAHQRHLS